MRHTWVLGLLLASASCSEKDPAQPVETGSVNEMVFASDDYTLGPGEEKYICWAHDLPADQDAIIREISGDYGPATHHVFFAWTLIPEPEGMSECPVLFKTTWIPVYLGGKNTSPLKMPDDAAVDLGRGKQLVLQLHLQNTSDAPITTHTTMHMKLGEPGVSYTPAGIYGLDNRAIDIPPDTDDVETSMTCKPGKDMNVFATLGHMHKLGKQLTVTKNGDVVVDQVWNFDEQPINPLEMTVTKDDSIGLACTHKNPLQKTVTYGESSDNEMCATIFFYTPYDQLDGCINAPDPTAPIAE
jgi:hypothetical protein